MSRRWCIQFARLQMIAAPFGHVYPGTFREVRGSESAHAACVRWGRRPVATEEARPRRGRWGGGLWTGGRATAGYIPGRLRRRAVRCG